MTIPEKLGFPKTTKLLIIHADDAGLSHSENQATIQSLQKGIVNSYSIMMPCAWWFEMALFAKTNPQHDYGIHLTLTCEWENYKFGPILPASEVPSLVDENGHFFKTRAALKNNATTEDVKKELTAQIEKAIKFGLNPSHLDSHMYSLGASPALFKIYKELGNEYNLPVFINKQLLEMVGLDLNKNIAEKDILFDKAHYGIYEYFESGKLKDYFNNVFADLVEGLNIILIHPAFDNHEMKGITINHPNFGSEWRQIAFDVFTSNEMKAQLEGSDVQLITWGDLKKMKK